MKVNPLYGRVVLKRVEAEEKSSGGIIFAETSKEKPQRGTVLSVGHGRIMPSGELMPLKVKVGDVVLFGKYSGTEVTENGEKVLLMSEDDILATLTEE